MPAPPAEAWTLVTLADLTGQPEHASQPLPQVWVQWLTATFPDAEHHVEIPEPTPGQLDMLLERHRVVLRVKHFTRASLRAIAQGWVLAVLAMTQEGWIAGGALLAAGTSLLDQFRKIGEALVKLDDDAGEPCTYAAIVRARDEERRALGLFPDEDQIWAAHQQVRAHCPVETCVHHRDGCQATRADIDVVIERLVDLEVLERKKGGLWPTL